MNIARSFSSIWFTKFAYLILKSCIIVSLVNCSVWSTSCVISCESTIDGGSGTTTLEKACCACTVGTSYPTALAKDTGFDELLCRILRSSQYLARFFAATILSCYSLSSLGLSLRGFWLALWLVSFFDLLESESVFIWLFLCTLRRFSMK